MHAVKATFLLKWKHPKIITDLRKHDNMSDKGSLVEVSKLPTRNKAQLGACGKFPAQWGVQEHTLNGKSPWMWHENCDSALDFAWYSSPLTPCQPYLLHWQLDTALFTGWHCNHMFLAVLSFNVPLTCVRYTDIINTYSRARRWHMATTDPTQIKTTINETKHWTAFKRD